MLKRPYFIDRASFRQHLTRGKLDKLFTIGKMLPSSFITQQDKAGKPIKYYITGSNKLYRPIDLVVRAYALNLPINKTRIEELKDEEYNLKYRVEALRKNLAILEGNYEKNKHKVEINKVSQKVTGDLLISEREVVSRSADINTLDKCGVYFLIDTNKVVYVGQSVNVYARLCTHKREKQFDRYTVLPCSENMLDTLESMYIHFFRPKYNGVHKGRAKKMVAPVRQEALLKLIA